MKSGGLAVGISGQLAEAEHQLCRVSTEPMVQSLLSRAPGPAVVISSCNHSQNCIDATGMMSERLAGR